MILPPRLGATRRRAMVRPSSDPSLGSVVAGTIAFLIIAAFCLYAVARLST